MVTTDRLDLRTVVILLHGGRLLLLRRAPWKRFAPGRWTGLGGKVEPGELDDLTAAARRELFEETDLRPDEVSPLVLRRVLTFVSPAEGLVCLAYFTGDAYTGRTPACHEGTLQWVSLEMLGSLDIIENTARVLPLLLDDVQHGRQGVRCGVACYDERGQLRSVSFDCPPDTLTLP